MNKHYLPLISFIIFLLSISLSFANTGTIAHSDYNETGNFDSLYQLGIGQFNDDKDPIADTDIAQAIISRQFAAPLVSDLNGDGKNEIIVFDDGQIKTFQTNFPNPNLKSNGSFTFGSTPDRISNILIFDIDDDTKPEIILIFEEERQLHIIGFENGTLIAQNGVNGIDLDVGNIGFTGTPAAQTGETMIKCKAANKCIMTYNPRLDFPGAAERSVNVVGFNSTRVFNDSFNGGITRLQVQATSNRNFCAPNIKNIAVADYDENDGGTEEFMFTWINTGAGGGENYIIFWVDLLDNGSVFNDQDPVTESATDFITPSADCETTNAGRFFSPPIVFDVDLAGGKELIFARNVDADEFNIIVLKTNGDRLDEHPEIFDADGTIVSNVFRANIFDDSGDTDYCVMGFDSDDSEIDLICASQLDTVQFSNDLEFFFDTQSIANLFNVTQSYGSYNILAHSGRHKEGSFTIGETAETGDPDEIIAAWGVFEPSTASGCNLFNTCSLDLIFQQPRGDGVVITSDLNKDGLEDMIVLTSTNLFYIDDLLADRGPDIIESSIILDPCVSSIWKINTSVEISYTVKDRDSIGVDDVTGSVTLYADDSNAQTETLGPFSTGVNNAGVNLVFGSSFVVNKTVVGGTIRLSANDTGGSGEVDIIDIPFNVGTNGVEQGDCQTIGFGVIEEGTEGFECDFNSDCNLGLFCNNNVCEDEPADLLTQSRADNTIKTALIQTGDTLGGISALSIYILFMGFAAIFIFMGNTIFNRQGEDEGHKLGTIIIVEIMLLIFGTLVGIIPVGIIITIAVIGIIAVGLFVSRSFTSTRT